MLKTELPSDRASCGTLESIQICRGVAALLVVMFHLSGAIAAPKYFGVTLFDRVFIACGGAGVDFFFVLSGFIIASIHRSDIACPASFPSYIYKRCVRIYPIYWIVFASVAATAYLVPGATAGHPEDILSLLKALTLFPQEGGVPVIAVAWSLQYEMIFYVFFGLLILSRFLAVGVFAIAAAWAAAASIYDSHTPFGFLSLEYFALFCAGAVVASLVRANWSARVAQVAITIGVIGFIAMAAIVSLGEIPKHDALKLHISTKTLGFGAFASLIIFGLVVVERRGWQPEWREGILLGDASYALYLIHYPIISVACKIAIALGLTGLLGASITWISTFAICIASGLFLHLWIERPMMKLARGTFGRHPAISSPA